jgi:hypothetical protein
LIGTLIPLRLARVLVVVHKKTGTTSAMLERLVLGLVPVGLVVHQPQKARLEVKAVAVALERQQDRVLGWLPNQVLAGRVWLLLKCGPLNGD